MPTDSSNEILTFMSRQLDSTEKLTDGFHRLEIEFKAKSASDQVSFTSSAKDISELKTLLKEKDTALSARISVLEEESRAHGDKAVAKAEEVARYWGRWSVGTIVALGITIVGILIKLKG